jgi:transcriptional regulatory protein RtcR
VQLIAAASRDPGDLVRAGRLRPDLYARLAQWQFRLPPLRERREDVEAHLLHLKRYPQMQTRRQQIKWQL